MFHHLHYSFAGLLPRKLSPEVRELYWSSLLQNLALSMLLLFEPIYLWQQGLGVRGIVLFFLGVYLVYLFVVPLGANFATRFGFEHSMALSTIWQVFYLICLYLVAVNWWWLMPAALLYVLQKAFYWPAYHADFAHYAVSEEEGREVSGLTVAVSLVFVIGPILAGLILQFSSWAVLFIIASGLILLSSWPLLKTPEKFEPRAFPYKDAFARLWSRANRKLLLGYLGFGEELILLTLWPVFMVVVLVNYVEIGAVAAVATLFTAMTTLYIGRLIDKNNKNRILRLATWFYFTSWVARLFIKLPVHIFMADSWSRLSKNLIMVPITTITYERAQNNRAMDTVVFFEMSLVVGKILAALILLVVFSFTTSWSVVWGVGALMSLLYLKL